MLASKNLQNALTTEESDNVYKDTSNDHDFSQVLEFCGEPAQEEQKVRYANGQEKIFSFDN